MTWPVLTFQDAVDGSLQSRVCVGVGGWGELRGEQALLGGALVVHLFSCCKRWAVTWGVSVGCSLAAVAGAAGPVVLLRSLRLRNFPALCERRLRFVCCARSRVPASSGVSVPGYRVCPVRRLCRARLCLTKTTVGQRLRWERILEKFRFCPTAEVFQKTVCRGKEARLTKLLLPGRRATGLCLCPTWIY